MTESNLSRISYDIFFHNSEINETQVPVIDLMDRWWFPFDKD